MEKFDSTETWAIIDLGGYNDEREAVCTSTTNMGKLAGNGFETLGKVTVNYTSKLIGCSPVVEVKARIAQAVLDAFAAGEKSIVWK